MSNFKSAAKRKRELAKLDKRHAKEQKRAVRRAERSANVGAATPPSSTVVEPALEKHRLAKAAAPVLKPKTLAEAAAIWRSTKVVKPKRR